MKKDEAGAGDNKDGEDESNMPKFLQSMKRKGGKIKLLTGAEGEDQA